MSQEVDASGYLCCMLLVPQAERYIRLRPQYRRLNSQACIPGTTVLSKKKQMPNAESQMSDVRCQTSKYIPAIWKCRTRHNGTIATVECRCSSTS